LSHVAHTKPAKHRRFTTQQDQSGHHTSGCAQSPNNLL
jgi:hypothetical protein